MGPDKGNGKSESKSKNKRGFFAPLRMTNVFIRVGGVEGLISRVDSLPVISLRGRDESSNLFITRFVVLEAFEIV